MSAIELWLSDWPRNDASTPVFTKEDDQLQNTDAQQDQPTMQRPEAEDTAQMQPHLLIETNIDGSALTFDELEKLYQR